MRLPEEKRLDKQIEICRFGAKRDNVTVLIERPHVRKTGETIMTPILEISPAGDIAEVLAPTLRTPIRIHMHDQHVRYLEGSMNAGMRAGHERLGDLVEDTRDTLATERADSQRRANRGPRRYRANRQRRKGARPVNHSNAVIS